MRIDNMMPFMSSYKQGNAAKAAALGHVSGKSNHDILTISSKSLQGNEKTTANIETMTAIKEQAKTAHSERVERIKVDIQNGTYSVANDLVADAVIRRAGEGRHQ